MLKGSYLFENFSVGGDTDYMSSRLKPKGGGAKPRGQKKRGWDDDDPNPRPRVEPVGRIVGNTPRSNQAQKEQIDYLARVYGLTKQQRERLHKRIKKQGYSYDEIKKIIEAGDYFQADREAVGPPLWLFEAPLQPTVPRTGHSQAQPCRIETVQIWLKAFIPGSLPGLTRTVPSGPHVRKTMIPGPTFINDCFLTDQRSFSNGLRAPSRMTSAINIDVLTPKVVNQTHSCDPTVEVDCEDGAVECQRSGNTSRMKFSNFNCLSPCTASNRTMTVQLQGAANNPCFTGSPDIDYRGTVTIQISSLSSGQVAQVSFNGFVDDFPAFEMYASINGGAGMPLFRLNSLPGKTPANLLGDANRPVRGSVRLVCGVSVKSR
jgi:hypothetical protein